MKQNVTLELVLELAKQLTPVEQVRLVEETIFLTDFYNYLDNNLIVT